MKIVAAYLLAVLGGNANPSAADIKSILNSVGAEAEESMIDLLLKETSGKDIAEIIASGREKLASVTSTVGGAASVAVGGGAPADAPAAAETKEEEKKAEIVEEEEEDMIFGLFD